MSYSQPPHRKNEDNEFQQARHFLSTRRLKTRFLSDKKFQLVALHLYRAIDDYNYRGDINNQVEFNEQLLRSIQDDILKQKFNITLKTYSEGFILGALANLLRRYEANIKVVKKYERVFNLLKKWQEIGISDDMSDFVKETVTAAEELLGWIDKRSKELCPIGLEIIQLFIEPNEPISEEILQQISQKREEKEIFFFLSGCLQVNKGLFDSMKSECQDRQMNIKEFFLFLEKMMKSLQFNAKNKEVQGLVKLFLEGYDQIK